MVIDAAQYSPGALLLLHKSFLTLGNAARCAPLKIPQNASEDDIHGLFFHDVLSTAPTVLYATKLVPIYIILFCHILFYILFLAKYKNVL